MREDLIERLREGCVVRPKRWSGDTHDDLGGSIEEGATDALMSEAAAALEAAREDSERLDWLWRDSGLEGFVNVDADVHDFAQDVADDNNRDEPSREDYNAGFRRLIDAAIDAARKEVDRG